MKPLIAILASIITLSVAQADFKADLDALANREVKMFDTADHPKSQGIKLKISYPASWLAEEGNRPAIVQKFRSAAGKGIGHFTVTISPPMPDEVGSVDPEMVWDDDFLPTVVPPGATILDFQKTKLDGEPAGLIAYTINTKNAGIDLTMRVVSFHIIRKRSILSLNGNLVKLPSQSTDEFESQATKAKLLYQAISSSLVLTDKWEK